MRCIRPVIKEYFVLISPAGVRFAPDGGYLFYRNSPITRARTIRKTSVLLKSRASAGGRNMIVPVFYYSTPATFTAGSFLLHFPIFFLHPLPPVFPQRISRKRRSLERRRTGAGLTKTIKSDFFPSRRANPLGRPAAASALPTLFPARSDPTFFTSSFYALPGGTNPQAYLKKLDNYSVSMER